MKSLIYFVPGIKGSVLYSKKSGNQLWPPENILNSWTSIFKPKYKFDEEMMELRVTDNIDDMHDDPAIDVGGVIKSVQIGPFKIYEKQVYGKILDYIKNEMIKMDDTGMLIEFSYDWRRSMEYCANKLYNSILTTMKDYEYDRLILITHSYGGLISRYMVERNADNNFMIQYMLNIGAPHYGSMKSIDYITGISSIPFCSDDVLTEICQTFDSLYDTLPYDFLKDDSKIIGNLNRLLHSRKRRDSMNICCNTNSLSVMININIVNIYRVYNNDSVYCSGDGVVDVNCKNVSVNNRDIINDLKHNEHIEILNKKYTKNTISYVLSTASVKDFNIRNMLKNNLPS